jgi:hypothetical protein
MTRYSAHIQFNNLGFIAKIEAADLEEANILARELAKKEFGTNLEGIIYDIGEAIDGDL